MIVNTAPAHRQDQKRPLLWAWWSLVLYPVSFIIAFIVGEGDGRTQG